jgi:hypothetical protein
MNIMSKVTTSLYNGQKVKEGDIVCFVNSDGVKCEGRVQRRLFDCIHSETNEKLIKGTLFFWNNTFKISDYRNLVVP